jgi:hypothetical protein
MPTEIVVLTGEPIASQAVADTADQVVPAAVVVDVDGTGVRLVLDPDGRAVATVYAARAVTVRAEAEAALRGGADRWTWWTDVTIPYGDPTRGRELALRLAQAVGGVVKVRT